MKYPARITLIKSGWGATLVDCYMRQTNAHEWRPTHQKICISHTLIKTTDTYSGKTGFFSSENLIVLFTETEFVFHSTEDRTQLTLTWPGPLHLQMTFPYTTTTHLHLGLTGRNYKNTSVLQKCKEASVCLLEKISVWTMNLGKARKWFQKSKSCVLRVD